MQTLKVDIQYIIDNLGKSEKTILYGYKENDYFFLGNENNKRTSGFKRNIKKIFEDKVVLEIDKEEQKNFTDVVNELEIKKGEELKSLYLPITPSPRF